MPANILEKLPREIIQLVGEYLEVADAQSVTDLARASKYSYTCIAPLLFRTLKFSVHDSRQLAEDVQKYSQILQRLDGYRHVRRLIIDSGDKKISTEKTPEPQQQKKEQPEKQQQQQWHRPRLSITEYSGHDDEILEGMLDGAWRSHKYKDQLSLEAVYETNDAWSPLADFIGRLTALDAIFYDSRSQFPPCLLESLHQHQPQSRLYINLFRLRSLNAEGTDDYEFSLLSSPCLYGITVRSEGLGLYDSNKGPIYDTEALRCLVAGLAPNLKRLHVIRDRHTATARHHRPRHPWKGFIRGRHGLESQESRGSLEYLRIWSLPGLSKNDVEIWNKITDFSALQILRFDRGLDTSALEYLATQCHFPSLTRLEMDYRRRTDALEGDAQYLAASDSFLLSLPALSVLKLSGWQPAMATDSVLAKHGPRLRQLSLLSHHGETLSLPELYQMAESCQVLEELTIQIKRSRGDVQEVAKYKALGHLPRLQYLHLKLDASDYTLLAEREEDGDDGIESIGTPDDPSFNEFDQQYCQTKFHNSRYPRNGHIRDAFINSALDRHLAYAIYQTIYSERQPDFTPLRRMEVEGIGGGQFHVRDTYLQWSEFLSVFGRLARSCCITRVIGEDGNFEILVKSSGASHDSAVDLEPKPLRSWLEEIFRRLWPAKSQRWWEDWHSFPLAMSVDEQIDWKSR